MATDAPLGTVVNAFEVLDVLRRIDGGGPMAIARELDMPKSTAHEYLKTLEAIGFVINDGGSYNLSLRLLQIGSQIQYRRRLFHVARSEVVKLANTTGQSANVTVVEHGRAVILYSEGEVEGINIGTYPGLVTPMHTLAAGKVILAHKPRSFAEDVIDEHGLEQATSETIVDRETLFSELDRIESQGYAADADEHVVGMGLVASPIVHDGEILGSIVIACPTSTLAVENRQEEFVEATQRAAKVVAFNYEYA